VESARPPGAAVESVLAERIDSGGNSYIAGFAANTARVESDAKKKCFPAKSVRGDFFVG
jgi:hypothetical protein